jgi:phosphohistidine phosphatase
MPCLRLYLVHHGDAVEPDVDPRRPLSDDGRLAVERLASEAARRGVRPEVVWHSGKLRARQTAEIFWRACNALAPCSATRDLQPSDPPSFIRDRLRHEPHDILIAGHFPHLPALLALLHGRTGDDAAPFPLHGLVSLRTDDEGDTWREEYRLDAIRDT